MANPKHVSMLKLGVKYWNEWRKENTKIEPDLREADLSRVDLSEANLSRADLSWANLNRADLSWADLSRSNLNWAELRKTWLNRANFTESSLFSTVFADVDLSVAKGLDSVTHNGPSTIGIDTLYKSQGKIPEVFLRGCGVDQIMIEYIPSLTLQPLQFYSCFISYSHEDKAFARRLHDTLQGLGIRCWLDEHRMLPGDDIHDTVDRAIRVWDKILLCCSEASLNSWWVDSEIDTAFDKEQDLWKERGRKTLSLIPLDLDGYLFSGEWQSGKAVQVRKRRAADFTGWKTDNDIFDTAVEKVILALQTEETRPKDPAPQL